MKNHTLPALWLLFVAALVGLMVVVGGATRLTESGLSIVEWKPISGTLPPLNAAAWEAAFAAYRQTPEYLHVNKGMTLADFQGIYWWEYAHRLLGRLIGVAFALPLLLFWLKNRLPAGSKPRLLLLLALGGLQGAVGWWMVASGLVDRTDVSPYRLAVHLSLALLILALLVATARDWLRPSLQKTPDSLKFIGYLFSFLLAVQILFGALVAGMNAGFAFNTWPRMGEDWLPAEALRLTPFVHNIVANPIMVQFIHRSLAILVLASGLALIVRGYRVASLRPALGILGVALIGQMALGILTLLHGVPIALGVAHQGGAAVLVALTAWVGADIFQRPAQS